jgi:hypothetical protein
MVTKPLYGKILVSRSFPNQEDARDFAKEYKAQYKQADLSIKYDINRTSASEWTATVYVKI